MELLKIAMDSVSAESTSSSDCSSFSYPDGIYIFVYIAYHTM